MRGERGGGGVQGLYHVGSMLGLPFFWKPHRVFCVDVIVIRVTSVEGIHVILLRF